MEVEDFLTGVRTVGTNERVLATLLFTDVVGSTALATKLGDHAWRELLIRYYSLVRRHVDRFRGVEVGTEGDGFFARFDGPARAVACARAIRDGVQGLGLEVRSGAHTGEVEFIAEDVTGMAVNIAARVSSLAADGEVLVSRTAKDLVVGSGLEWTRSVPFGIDRLMAPPIPPTTAELVELQQHFLLKAQLGAAHLHNAIGGYQPPNNVPDPAQLRRDMLQETSLGVIVREMTRFEDDWPKKLWHRDAFVSFPGSLDRLKAWLHLRHVGAHSPDGRTRIDHHGRQIGTHRFEFDAVTAGQGLSGVSSDMCKDTVEIDSSFFVGFYDDLRKAIGSGLANHGQIKPV